MGYLCVKKGSSYLKGTSYATGVGERNHWTQFPSKAWTFSNLPEVHAAAQRVKGQAVDYDPNTLTVVKLTDPPVAATWDRLTSAEQIMDRAVQLLDELALGDEGCPSCKQLGPHLDRCRLQKLILDAAAHRNQYNPLPR